MSAQVMDEETRKRMEALLGTTTGSSVAYTPTVFEPFPEAFRPKFQLRAFTKAELREINKWINTDTIQKLEYMEDWGEKAITGWENFFDKRGAEISIEARKDVQIPTMVLVDCFNRAYMISMGIEEDAKRGLESSPQSA